MVFSRVSLLAPAVGVALVLSAAVPAQAATPTIRPIKAAKAEYKGSVRIKPSYRSPSGVVVSKARLDVRRGGRTIARDKASVAVRAGTYRVTQVLTYRTFTTKTRSSVAVPAGAELRSDGWIWNDHAAFIESCTYTAVDAVSGAVTVNCPVYRMNDDFDQVRLGSYTLPGTYVSNDGYWFEISVGGGVVSEFAEPIVGGSLEPEAVFAPSPLYVSQRYRAYSGFRTKRATHTLRVAQHPKPRGCSKPADFRRVRNGMSVAQVRRVMQNKGKVTYSSGAYALREYKACDTYDYMSVSFEGGYVYDKTLVDF